MRGHEVAYSARWRETFGRVAPETTAREVAFLRSVLPRPEFRRVLDVACGFGRHVAGLADAGYDAVGIDNDEAAVEEALRAGLDARLGDMRQVAALGERDAVICMWASFGFFDEEENRVTLRGFRDLVRVGGRVVLDVTDRAFFEQRQGERLNAGVLDRKWIAGGRLYTELTYPDGARDAFDWQAWDAVELEAFARGCGLETVLACAGFDPSVPARGEQPRMQLVLERR